MRAALKLLKRVYRPALTEKKVLERSKFWYEAGRKWRRMKSWPGVTENLYVNSEWERRAV